MTLYAPEGAKLSVTLSDSNVDLTDKTVNFNLVDVNTLVKTLVGSGVGLAAGISVVAVCDFSLVASGSLYELEVIADETADNPITMVPNDTTGWPVNVYVKPVYSI